MSSLYSDLAVVYEAMYATFIDYTFEYEFYSEILKKWNKTNVLEIGSGTGVLASYFNKNGFAYCGMDLSREMLDIAIKKNPDGVFIEADMRSFELKRLVQSIIITGRTISYLRSNEDVNSTFNSAHNNLETGGLLCFDFIDANRFIVEIYKGKEVIHEARYNETKYIRKSKWDVNLDRGMCFDWESVYYKKEKNDLIEIGTDHSIIRTFTKDELAIFLFINNFRIKEIIDKESYAFPTYVIIAEKV